MKILSKILLSIEANRKLCFQALVRVSCTADLSENSEISFKGADRGRQATKEVGTSAWRGIRELCSAGRQSDNESGRGVKGSDGSR